MLKWKKIAENKEEWRGIIRIEEHETKVGIIYRTIKKKR
jgi:hypothetical protein